MMIVIGEKSLELSKLITKIVQFVWNCWSSLIPTGNQRRKSLTRACNASERLPKISLVPIDVTRSFIDPVEGAALRPIHLRIHLHIMKFQSRKVHSLADLEHAVCGREHYRITTSCDDPNRCRLAPLRSAPNARSDLISNEFFKRVIFYSFQSVFQVFLFLFSKHRITQREMRRRVTQNN